jgi:hypothetical protein
LARAADHYWLFIAEKLMSLRVVVVDRLREVARQLESTASFAVLSEEGQLNWADPVHVKRDADATASPRSTLMMFQELASKAKPSGSAFELSPGLHCLILPVPFKGKRVALGCVVVRADDRLAYYMSRLAKLLLQRDDYFSEGIGGPAGDE